MNNIQEFMQKKNISANRVVELANRQSTAQEKYVSHMIYQMNCFIEKHIENVSIQLENRPNNNTDYVQTDDDIFSKYISLVVANSTTNTLCSLTQRIGYEILRTVFEFEKNNAIKINKRVLYLGLSLTDIMSGNYRSATRNLELHLLEDKSVTRKKSNPKKSITDAIYKYQSFFVGINNALDNNTILNILKTKSPNIIQCFNDILRKQTKSEVYAYLSATLQYVGINYWLNQEVVTPQTRLYAQEVINTLCILVETGLKKKLSTNDTIGKILQNNLTNINISNIIGRSRRNSTPASGLFGYFPNEQFNYSLKKIIQKIKTRKRVSDDEMSAYLLYGAYLVRNNSLHSFEKGKIQYYSNNNLNLFLDIFGLLFGALSVIKYKSL